MPKTYNNVKADFFFILGLIIPFDSNRSIVSKVKNKSRHEVL